MVTLIAISLFGCWIIFYCMYVPKFIYTVAHWWTFGSFWLLGYYEYRCYEQSGKRFYVENMWIYVFILFDCIVLPRGRITRIYVNFIFNSSKNCHMIFNSGYYLFAFPLAIYKSILLSPDPKLHLLFSVFLI